MSCYWLSIFLCAFQALTPNLGIDQGMKLRGWGKGIVWRPVLECGAGGDGGSWLDSLGHMRKVSET